MKIIVLLVVAAVFVCQVDSHGSMDEPVPRTDPANGNIERNFRCSNCGPCGDNLKKASPRKHENGGEYGNGKITATYKSGQIVDVKMRTFNHAFHIPGKIEFAVCKLEGKNPETEECMQALKVDGKDSFIMARGTPTKAKLKFEFKVQLPDGLVCDHCSFRWTFKTSRTSLTYINCADIKITN